MNDAERLQLLLSNSKIDSNLKDNFGWTPLMLAIRENASECVHLLLDHPPMDPNIKNNNGDSALMHVVKHNKVEYLEIEGRLHEK